jgi:hypothetical protein
LSLVELVVEETSVVVVELVDTAPAQGLLEEALLLNHRLLLALE